MVFFLILFNFYLKESLLGTISRTLRDDYKKNVELCLYLLCVFFIYSNYE